MQLALHDDILKVFRSHFDSTGHSADKTELKMAALQFWTAQVKANLNWNCHRQIELVLLPTQSKKSVLSSKSIYLLSRYLYSHKSLSSVPNPYMSCPVIYTVIKVCPQFQIHTSHFFHWASLKELSIIVWVRECSAWKYETSKSARHEERTYVQGV